LVGSRDHADYSTSLRGTPLVSLDGGKAQGLFPVDFNRA
jgi:hypothetical protein